MSEEPADPFILHAQVNDLRLADSALIHCELPLKFEAVFSYSNVKLTMFFDGLEN
jgi:hypothetical protein